MKYKKRIAFICTVILFGSIQVGAAQYDDWFKKITFDSADGVKITADLYMVEEDKSFPFIVFCHQAGWSRGEYREIVPRLNELGINGMAIDQRSGGEVNDVKNETLKAATDAGKKTTFVDAEQDIIAALKYARENYADGKLIVWGSSYSASLVLRIAGENPDLVDGVVSFAPGEYFGRLGKPGDWIASSAKKIKVPVFITSAKNEVARWEAIYNAIEGDSKTKYVPKTAGNHGSRALWKEFDDSAHYWEKVEAFVGDFLDE